MTFKDLKKYLDAKDKIVDVTNYFPLDAEVACNIIDLLFNQTNDSLQRDRSTVKLNLFERGVVSSGLNRVMPGTKKFLAGMYPNELNALLDDIEKELARRSKNLNINSLLTENAKLRKELGKALLRINELEKK